MSAESEEIGAYFQCYKQPTATYHALLNFRRSYPTGSVVLLSDAGYDYSRMAAHFGATYVHSKDNIGVAAGPGKPLGPNLSQFRRYIARLVPAIEMIDAAHFMWLEDDVRVIRRYSVPFAGTLNGNVVYKIAAATFDAIPFCLSPRVDSYYTGHGGTVYEKASFLAMLRNDSVNDWLIDNWSKLRRGKFIDNDLFFSLSCYVQGMRVERLAEHSDGAVRANTAVLHRDKQFYNVKPDDTIRALFDGS